MEAMELPNTFEKGDLKMKKIENGVNESAGSGKKKNVISEIDKGDYILQKRQVQRKIGGKLMEPKIYDLKIPKSTKAFAEIYGTEKFLKLAIASLKTEYDDAQMPSSANAMPPEIKELKARVKNDPDLLARIRAIMIENPSK